MQSVCCRLQVLALIGSSLHGLPEKSLLQLLGDLDASCDTAVSAWATARLQLKPFIRRTVCTGAVRIQMSHELFNDVSNVAK